MRYAIWYTIPEKNLARSIFFCGAGMHHKSKQGAQKMVQRICNNFNPEMWQNDETKCFHIQYSEEIFPFFPLLLNFFQQHKKN